MNKQLWKEVHLELFIPKTQQEDQAANKTSPGPLSGKESIRVLGYKKYRLLQTTSVYRGSRPPAVGEWVKRRLIMSHRESPAGEIHRPDARSCSQDNEGLNTELDFRETW